MSVEFLLIPIAISIASALAASQRKQIARPNCFVIGTRLKDPKLLQAALSSLGCRSVSSGADVQSTSEGAQISFEKNEDGLFDAVFAGVSSQERAATFLQEVDAEYTRLLQEQVYKRLMARAKDRGLNLESQEVQADNSIVLTFTV